MIKDYALAPRQLTAGRSGSQTDEANFLTLEPAKWQGRVKTPHLKLRLYMNYGILCTYP
jgi:hypothetical protein